MTTFAERLKNAMEQANMSQSALSEPVSYTHLRAHET